MFLRIGIFHKRLFQLFTIKTLPNRMFSNLMHHFFSISRLVQFLFFKELFFQCLFKTCIDLLVYCLFQFSKFVSFLTWPHCSNKKNPKFFFDVSNWSELCNLCIPSERGHHSGKQNSIVCTPHWFKIHAIIFKREVFWRITVN